ncbi:hypothetical protein PR003_g10986 [Phytophthora rubi]|uniref:Uncharacterized protein n=1 Tax=Phytophthora rubi TaxID=129364 RepID=A0A6A4FDU4_9STRA|nr:hypothetical protein PR003_g10986 [Phytophthora rubi]
MLLLLPAPQHTPHGCVRDSPAFDRGLYSVSRAFSAAARRRDVFASVLGKHARNMIAYFGSIVGVTKLEDNYNQILAERGDRLWDTGVVKEFAS